MLDLPLQLQEYEIILASGSPRRKALLESLDIPFSVDVRPVDERFPASLNPSEVAEYLAQKKSTGWGDLNSNQLLITADTVVCLDHRILEKPKDQSDAIRMLRELSGAVHLVYTGVCLRTANKTVSFTDCTEVTFRELTVAEIEFYVNKYKPFDKAGSYGAQEWMGMIAVTELRGSYFNVMGLPVHRLYSALEELLNK